MDRVRLIARLMTTFLGELEEHVRALNRDLLALEKTPPDGHAELLQTLFRTAHSFKGAAHSAGVHSIELACHRLEGILGAARDGERPLTPDLIQLLFTATDALKDAGDRLRAGRELSDAPLRSLIPRLEAAERDVAAPSSAPTVTERPPLAATSTGLPVVRDSVVRVSADKLDALLARSGELLIARRRTAVRHDEVSQLRDAVQRCISQWRRLEGPLRNVLKSNGSLLPKRAIAALDRTRESVKNVDRGVELLASNMAADARALEHAAAPLEEEIRQVRMLPFHEACEGLERVVRDLARAGGKQVDLVIEGGEVEIDRAVVDRLKDPVVHLLRNAVDHGVESPDGRRECGKPLRATITVAAALRGNGVEVVVADDGRGLDVVAISEHARQRGLKIPEDDREAARLVFLPGFSTAQRITELSGRGVGLDVVKHAVESLHGYVQLTSEPGLGTCVVLNVPLTLTTIRALLLRAGGQVFALPTMNVWRLARVDPAEFASIEGRDVLLSDGPPIPLVSLADILGLHYELPRPIDDDEGRAQRAREGAARGEGVSASDRAGVRGRAQTEKVPLVIATAGDKQVAFVVEELVAEQEFVVKNLGRRIRRVRHVTGATVLPTGHVALILSAADLIQTALAQAPRRTLVAEPAPRGSTASLRLLLAEDSVTTRSLEKSILEAAGYEVVAAVDGADAWRLLQEKGADLVVADVEMPRMDGFALCEAIRRSKRFRELPVVLVTALETDRDKARGLEVGADAYLPKSAFDQRQLLETIAQLL